MVRDATPGLRLTIKTCQSPGTRPTHRKTPQPKPIRPGSPDSWEPSAREHLGLYEGELKCTKMHGSGECA